MDILQYANKGIDVNPLWGTISDKHTDYAQLDIYSTKDTVLEVHSMVDTSIPLCTARAGKQDESQKLKAKSPRLLGVKS